jgi:hypothetical protein
VQLSSGALKYTKSAEQISTLCVFQHQQLAAHVGDELYYIPLDPTAQSSQGNTSLTLANADGTSDGYVLYDGYSGTLTATLRRP